jgi:hypothetical protein
MGTACLAELMSPHIRDTEGGGGSCRWFRRTVTHTDLLRGWKAPACCLKVSGGAVLKVEGWRGQQIEDQRTGLGLRGS